MSIDLEEYDLQCPYCGESIMVLVDHSAGSQQYYEDCSVCCAPIFISVELHDDGSNTVVVKRDDE